MTNILMYDKDPGFWRSLEIWIKKTIPETSITKVSDIKSLLTSVTENTKLILLNCSWKEILEEIMEKIISAIKIINNEIAVILLTTASEWNIPEKIENQVDDILYSPLYDLWYLDVIRKYVN